jgi:hypothetical protein
MLHILEQWQESLGLIGFSSALVVAGIALGFVVGLLCRRRPLEPHEDDDDAPALADGGAAASEASGPKRDKRRNPRRPGRSVEVFVALAGSTQKPCKGVILNRSVGGLGILVGDEYPVGAMVGVLPATASHLEPWVESEVKTCRKLGDDWEIGLQFVQIPPYSTMIQFG